MGVTAKSASAEDTRTIIEGKLWDIDKDPNEVLVVIKDSDDDSGMLFSINDEGVILTIEAVMVSPMTSDKVESNVELCLALESE